MSQEDGGQKIALTEEELIQRYRQRARAVMMGFYSQDEHVHINGLYLQKVHGNDSLWDVFAKDENDEALYIDTLNVDQFASARQLFAQISDYRSRSESEPTEDVEDTDEPDPTRSFQ